MKILRLQFQNLNSLVGIFEIDFDRGSLADAGIFAITGSTGAGKTTLLDAITLALFGKAARYNNLNNPSEMMSRGSSECFAEVLFECAEGQFYARWDLRRARGKSDGKIQPAKRQLSDEQGRILESKLRPVDERIEALTGLDYPRFLRSVLLAQGRFKEFLDADANERGALLERITGTEIYSKISTTAFDLARQKEAEISAAHQALEGVKLLSDSEQQEISTEKQSLLSAKQQNQQQLETVHQQLQQYQQQQELQQKQQQLQQKQLLLQQEQKKLNPQLQQLAQHEKAAPLSNEVEQLKNAEKNLHELLQQQKTLQQQQQQIRQQNLTTLTAAHQTCEQQRQQSAQQSQQLSQEQSSLNQTLDTLQLWLQEHQQEVKIETELPQIRQQAEQCRSLQRQQDESLQGIQELQKNIQHRQSHIHQLQHQLSSAEQQRDQWLTTLKQHQQKLQHARGDHSSTSWQLQIEILQKKQHILDELSDHDADARLLGKAETQLLKSVKQLQIGYQKDKTDIKTCQTKRQHEQQRLEDKTLQHQQALAIQSLSSHRQQLQENQPCPLCGAQEHPYSEQSLPSESETETALKQQQEQLKQATEEQASAEQQLQQRKNKINNQTEQLHKNRADIKGLAERFSSKANKINLTLTLNEPQLLQEACQETQALLTKAKQQAETLKQVEKDQAQAEKEYLLFLAQQQSQKEQSRQNQQELELHTHELKQRQHNLAALLEKSQTAFDDFNATTANWTVAIHGSEQTQPIIDELEQRFKHHTEQTQQQLKLQQDQKNLKTQLERVGNELSQLLQEDEEWQQQLNQYRDLQLTQPVTPDITLTDANKRKQSVQQAKTRLAEIQALCYANLDSINSQQTQLQQQKAVLQEKLTQHQFKDLEQLRQSLLTEDEAKTLRQHQTQLREQQSKLDALWENQDNELNKLLDYNLPQGEAAQQLKLDYQQQQQQQTQLSERAGEINAILKADHEQRHNQQTQLKKISQLTKEAQKWYVLNDLIGSASGRKFPKFAQSLTLAQLIKLANFHLHKLNPRYQIQLKNVEELALEIVDLYQASSVRPTSSLSGGESFLVSLALALGLSELAGHKTRIESLFIDEGFGSLDAQTLDIALSALENLRLDNRTIAIISHVEALKTRLTTQIQVQRNGDGFSHLRIVDTVE
ncbi:MAG: AAA family ATPase [Gammaproteobacteria bacterium]|nr:AAA family ATPase [Gammaproteobacteria bacterium]